MGGELELHGEVEGRTWTQLDGTAEAGDEIALTSTSLTPRNVDRRTIRHCKLAGVFWSGDTRHRRYLRTPRRVFLRQGNRE